MIEQTPEISQLPDIPQVKNKSPLTIVLLVILGLIILAGAVYAGINIGKKQISPSQIISQPALVPSVIPQADETVYTEQSRSANWKTYSDEYLSFNYPPDWEVGVPEVFGSRNDVEFEYKLTSLFTLSKRGNYNQLTGKPNLSLDEFLGDRQKKYAADFKAGTYPAKRITDPGDEGHVLPSEEVLLFTPDKSFIVSLSYIKDYYDQPNQDNVLDNILSTFKFLD